MTSRMEDLPLKGDYSSALTQAPPEILENEGLKELSKLGFSGNLTLGSWISHSMANGGTATLPATTLPAATLPATTIKREAWA